MEGLPPELFPPILQHIPLIFRPSTCLSLALTSHHFHNIIAPRSLYKNVHLCTEEIAFRKLKHWTHLQQRTDNPHVHHIQNLYIESVLQLPVEDLGNTSFSWLKRLINLDGLKNLKALIINLSATKTKDDGRFDAFDPSGLWESVMNHCPALEKLDLCGFPLEYKPGDWAFRKLISSTDLTSLHLDVISSRAGAGSSVLVENIIPHVYNQLVALTIPHSSNANVLYFAMPYAMSHFHSFDTWVFICRQKIICDSESRGVHVHKPRFFDQDYLFDISEAAPRLGTLELMGPSRGSNRSLAASLSRLTYLRHLILSGPGGSIPRPKPFFESSRHWNEYKKPLVSFDNEDREDGSNDDSAALGDMDIDTACTPRYFNVK
ncbi:hypothetical protein BDQ17DRAFT_1425904 [Cyathus striatus]|nr:hypothetical protein BDQ17DRAFT_1425904 [Cyathus striatus]